MLTLVPTPTVTAGAVGAFRMGGGGPGLGSIPPEICNYLKTIRLAIRAKPRDGYYSKVQGQMPEPKLIEAQPQPTCVRM
jgi:hypothetical protein